MRKITILLTLVSLAGVSMGYYLLNYNDCGPSIACYDLKTKAYALYYGMGALLITSVVLTIFPKTFSAWKKFAIWFVPLATILFIVQDDKGQGFMEISPSSVQIFQWISILYIIISLIIIAVSLYTSRIKK